MVSSYPTQPTFSFILPFSFLLLPRLSFSPAIFAFSLTLSSILFHRACLFSLPHLLLSFVAPFSLKSWASSDLFNHWGAQSCEAWRGSSMRYFDYPCSCYRTLIFWGASSLPGYDCPPNEHQSRRYSGFTRGTSISCRDSLLYGC